MHSSTFNSDAPEPAGRWGATWLVALALTSAVLPAMEIRARRLGHRASVSQDRTLWSQQRARASKGGARAVALLGSSRMLLNVSTAQMRRDWPGHDFAMLAVDGTISSVATLRDLAVDESFRGVVVADVQPFDFLRENWPDQQAWVRHFHREFTAGVSLNRSLATAVQARVALPAVAGGRGPAGWLEARGWPRPSWVAFHGDRSASADFRRSHPVYRGASCAVPFEPDRLLAEAMRVDRLAARIRSRGGKVVFLQMPIGPTQMRRLHTCFPRDTFWDSFARRSTATLVHFEDHPALARFQLPDESHLDMRDAPRFTRELGRILASKGMLVP